MYLSGGHWSPIASAPRDGDPLDLWVESGNSTGRRVTNAYWFVPPGKDTSQGLWVVDSMIRDDWDPIEQSNDNAFRKATHWCRVTEPINRTPYCTHNFGVYQYYVRESDLPMDPVA